MELWLKVYIIDSDNTKLVLTHISRHEIVTVTVSSLLSKNLCLLCCGLSLCLLFLKFDTHQSAFHSNYNATATLNTFPFALYIIYFRLQWNTYLLRNLNERPIRIKRVLTIACLDSTEQIYAEVIVRDDNEEETFSEGSTDHYSLSQVAWHSSGLQKYGYLFDWPKWYIFTK